MVPGVLVLCCPPRPWDFHPACRVDPVYMLFCQASLTLPAPRQMLKEREDAFVPTHAHAGYEGSLGCVSF